MTSKECKFDVPTGVLTVPTTVTCLEGNAFKDREDLKRIEFELSSSVSCIGDNTFQNCTNLESITIPDSVNNICMYSFSGCSNLKEINIPKSLKIKSITKYAFQGCTSLTSITIPDTVKSIDEYAFQGCTNLITITFTGSLTTIGKNAFEGCSNLKNQPVVTLPLPNGFSLTNGVLTVSASVDRIEGYSFKNRTDIASISFQPGSSVQNIKEYAFQGCTNLDLCITIPDSVKQISFYAFDGCRNEGNILLPKNTVMYDKYGDKFKNSSFYNCSATVEWKI
jgi:hypothetical protein